MLVPRPNPNIIIPLQYVLELKPPHKRQFREETYMARNTPDQGHYVTRAAPNGIERLSRGMADCTSFAGCGQRAAAQRHCWARANEHIAATIPDEEEEKQREESENIQRNLTCLVPGRADNQ